MAASMSHVMGVPGDEQYPGQDDLAGKDCEATKYTDACIRESVRLAATSQC